MDQLEIKGISILVQNHGNQLNLAKKAKLERKEPNLYGKKGNTMVWLEP